MSSTSDGDWKVALDTNVLAYAESFGDVIRCTQAKALVTRLPQQAVVIPAQALGELANVLIRKAGRPAPAVRNAIQSWADSFSVADSTWASFQAALDQVTDHKLTIWDSLMLAVSAENACRLLLSEDLPDGFTWRGVTVVNPFAVQPSPLLAILLQQRS
ncbi:hypothetical protein CDEF62S_01396 [Castellaniella defragrans]